MWQPLFLSFILSGADSEILIKEFSGLPGCDTGVNERLWGGLCSLMTADLVASGNSLSPAPLHALPAAPLTLSYLPLGPFAGLIFRGSS